MQPTDRPVIGFLTDFGLDGAAATCRGVMLSICRDAQIVDVAHTVRKFAIRDGSFVLAAALPFLPVGHHVAVVDPGVGTERRPVAVQTGRGDILIGPDNGLLVAAADALGGIVAARVLEARALWLPVTSTTFHGRDIFSPVAAHLAAGTAAYDAVGPAIDPAALERLPAVEARVRPGRIESEVIYVDSFGNLRLAGGRADLEAAFPGLATGSALTVTIGASPGMDAVFAPTFGATGRGGRLVYVDSAEHLAAAENLGDLATALGVGPGDRVTLEGR